MAVWKQHPHMSSPQAWGVNMTDYLTKLYFEYNFSMQHMTSHAPDI